MDTLTQLQAMLGEREQILWYGRPNKKCFLLEAVFNPFLFIAVLWGAIDFAFIGGILSSAHKTPENSNFLWIMIPFFALHLMPVWIYLAGVFLSFRNYKNTHFIITEKGIYTSGGFFSVCFEHKSFGEIKDIQFRQGFFDQRLGVGDVVIEKKDTVGTGNIMVGGVAVKIPANTKKNMPNTIIIHDVPDYLEVYRLLKGLMEKENAVQK